MTQPPKPERRRRAQQHAAPQEPSAPVQPAAPEPIAPAVRKARTAQPRQPIGRSQELRERQEYMRQTQYDAPLQGRQPVRSSTPYRQPVQNRRLPDYSDFDDPVIHPGRPQRPVRRKKEKHTLLWLSVGLICLLISGVLLMFSMPQMMNVRDAGSPGIAFVDGGIIREDKAAAEKLRTTHAAMTNGRIYNGVYIDGIHVGGMTREEAIRAVNTVPGGAGSDFAITVNVGGVMYSINSDIVPLYRNVDEIVTQAYALGRSNSTQIRQSGVSPFRERYESMMALQQQPVAFYTTTTYDHGVVRSMADTIASEINREPVNASVATFDVVSKTFTYNSDESGLYISADAIYNDVVARLDSGAFYETLYYTPQELVADVTKAELMNSFGLISSFTTNTTSNSNRNTNIDLAAQAINGRTVLPGETFSFNQATGQRTAEKGYKPAAAIAGGETFDEIGGGVCQTSTTLFNAVARANLTIIDRDPHAWPSDYVPKGEDATVNWPNLDFRFRNDTQGPIFIVAKYASRKVTVEIYGITLGDGITIDLDSEVTYTKKPPSEPLYVQNPELPVGTEKTTVKARTGYTVETYKVWYQNGQEIKRELLHKSNYKMYQQTIEWN